MIQEDIITALNDPEKVYPGNFDTPQRANALLFGLCQEAAEEIKTLRGKLDRLQRIEAAAIAVVKSFTNSIDYDSWDKALDKLEEILKEKK